MIDWIFFAAWFVWMVSMALSAIRWQPLGLTPWLIGALVVLTHSVLLRRRITRLQDEIASRGLDDPDTQRARAASEAQLTRVIGWLKPLFFVSVGVFVVVALGAAFLSNMSMPRMRDIYDSRRPAGLTAIITVAWLYLIGFSFAMLEVPHAVKDFIPRDWPWRPTRRYPSDIVDETPTTLNLRGDDDQNRKQT